MKIKVFDLGKNGDREILTFWPEISAIIYDIYRFRHAPLKFKANPLLPYPIGLAPEQPCAIALID